MSSRDVKLIKNLYITIFRRAFIDHVVFLYHFTRQYGCFQRKLLCKYVDKCTSMKHLLDPNWN